MTRADQRPQNSIGTADIDNILLFCLQETQGKKMPPCLGTLLCKIKGLQWLILPVETVGSSGLEAYIQGFRTTLCRAPAQLRESMKKQILAEMASRWRDGDFHKFKELLWRHGINWQQVEEAEVEYRHSRGGCESLLVSTSWRSCSTLQALDLMAQVRCP